MCVVVLYCLLYIRTREYIKRKKSSITFDIKLLLKRKKNQIFSLLITYSLGELINVIIACSFSWSSKKKKYSFIQARNLGYNKVSTELIMFNKSDFSIISSSIYTFSNYEKNFHYKKRISFKPTLLITVAPM